MVTVAVELSRALVANRGQDEFVLLCSRERPWPQRLYCRTVLRRALHQAAAVLVPSESTMQDLLRLYSIPGLAQRLEVIPEGLPTGVAAGPLPDGVEPGFVLAVGTVEP